MRSTDDIVRQEVHCCMSSIVHTLASGYGRGYDGGHGDLPALTEQAFELSTPLLDYEEAAREAGWVEAPDGWSKKRGYGHLQHPGPIEALCDVEDLDPHEREVYEHWAVSDWLGRELAARGEKVDFDFGNLTIWARTTTGQGIASDSVIEDIAAALARA